MLKRFFFKLAWRFCLVDCYLATQRGDMREAADWFNKSEMWFGKWQRAKLRAAYAKG